MATRFEREVNRLLNLKQNKDKNPEDLYVMARRNILLRDFHAQPLFDITSDEGKKDQELAEKKFEVYLTNNEIESASDIDTLRSLIFNEIFELKIQKELNSLSLPPEKLTRQLVDIQNQKLSLKVKLGIDKKEEESDDLSAFQLLQKRVAKHINENKNEFTIFLGWQCEKCGYKDQESYLLYKPVKDFKILKHPFFSGKYLFSYPIVKDVKDGKLSKQDATRYLMGAGQGKAYNPSDVDKKYCEDYLDYLIENFTEITDLLQKNNPL